MKVRLRLCLTHDVFMELLSFVGNMKKLTSNTKCQVVYDSFAFLLFLIRTFEKKEK